MIKCVNESPILQQIANSVLSSLHNFFETDRLVQATSICYELCWFVLRTYVQSQISFFYLFLWSGTIGVYPVKPQIPAVGGYEGVGEVHAVGSAVKGLSPGDLVIPCPPSFGTLSLLMSLTYYISYVKFLFPVRFFCRFFSYVVR